MPKSGAERVASLRARQRRAGLATLTLVVPIDDTEQVKLWAKRRREQWAQGRTQSGRPATWPQRPFVGAARSAISSQDIRRLRELLEVTAIELVIERMTPRIAKRLRALADQEAAMDGDATARELQRFHLALAELSADNTLHFLLSIGLRVTEERSRFALRSRREREAVVLRVKESHARIVEAMLERNGPLAERRLRRYLSALEDWLG